MQIKAIYKQIDNHFVIEITNYYQIVIIINMIHVEV
jgi:hypothetical protein